ncbi:MAG: hypothetical protein PHO91_00815 [Patescibacteria group bacterium]|nr:hypothetical protein [Patescibacteria group bacterium]
MENQKNFIPKQEEEKNKAAELMTPEELAEVTNHLLRLQRQGLGDQTIDEAIEQLIMEIELRKSKGQKLERKLE